MQSHESFDALLARFDGWLAEAKAHPHISEPTAMNLATVDSHGQPDSRIVLLKAHDASGFIFYTNHTSAKSLQINYAGKAALGFYWMPLGKQVRVRGSVEAVTDAEADAYFASRARQSQLGAWASKQSQPLESRDIFEQRLNKYEQRFAGGDVPRPDFWSGWRVTPHVMEFWQELEFRLHHRERYSKQTDGNWHGHLLYP